MEEEENDEENEEEDEEEGDLTGEPASSYNAIFTEPLPPLDLD